MPVEFRMESKSGNVLENTRGCSRDSVRLLMAYDGSGRRVSKTRERKACISETSSGATSERTYAADWERELVTHYTGIGTEVRENYRNNALEKTKVVVNMPQGLGRYGIDNVKAVVFYLKNHLGSTMLVAKVLSSNAPAEISAAYDYRAFGEQITLSEPTDKVTENFTGKERDDETDLNYFGARYLDPMLGLWMSVDPKRQFASPYLYAGNGINPINGFDPDGFEVYQLSLGFRVAFVGGILFNVTLALDTDNPQNSDVYLTVGYGVGMEIGIPKMPLATPAVGWDEIREGKGSEINAGLGPSFSYDGETTDFKGAGMGVGGGYYDTYTIGIGKTESAQRQMNDALYTDYSEDNSHVFDDMVTDAD